MGDDAKDVRHAKEVQHVAELVDRARIGMLTTMTESGKHVSRPMALQEVEVDGDLWFFCYDDSAKGSADTLAARSERVVRQRQAERVDLTIGEGGGRPRPSAGRTAVGRPAEDGSLTDSIPRD